MAQQHADPQSQQGPPAVPATTTTAEKDPFAPHQELDNQPLPSEAEVRAFEKHTTALIDGGRARLDAFIACDEKALAECGFTAVLDKMKLKGRLRVWRELKAKLAPVENRHKKFTAEYREAVCAHDGLARRRDEAAAEAARLTATRREIVAALAAVEAELTALAQQSMVLRRERDVAVTNRAATDRHVEELRAEVAELEGLFAALSADVAAAEEHVAGASSVGKTAAAALATAAAAHASAAALAEAHPVAAPKPDAESMVKAEKAAILDIAVGMAEIDGGVVAFKKAAAFVMKRSQAVADCTAQLAKAAAEADGDGETAAKLEVRLSSMQAELAASRRVVNAVEDNVEAARRRHARNVKQAARRSGLSTAELDAAALQGAATAARDAHFKADRELQAASQELATAEAERQRIGARLASATARLAAFEGAASKTATATKTAEAAAAELVGSSDEHGDPADWWNATRKAAMAKRAALLDERDAMTRGIGKATRLSQTLAEERGTAEVRCRHLEGVLRNQLRYLVAEKERTDEIDHAKAVAILEKDGAYAAVAEDEALKKDEGDAAVAA